VQPVTAATANPANCQQLLAQVSLLDQTRGPVNHGQLEHSNLAQGSHSVGQVEILWASCCLAHRTPDSPQGPMGLAVVVSWCTNLCVARMQGGTPMPALHSVRVLRCQVYALTCMATA
jgi:hypothetical protein